MKRLFEMTRQEILTKGKNEDPAKFARRLNYVNSIKPMSIAKDLFIKTGTLTVPISVGDYTVTIHVSNIMKLIRKEMDKANRILPDRPIVYAALRQAVDQCELQVNCTCPDFCLVGETKIKLLNGEVVPVSEMKDKFDSGEQLWVYSVDKLGEFVPGKVLSVWVSGYRTDLLKVTLDNDEEIITTPNHLYLKRNGEYIAAEELRVGDSLMPLYFKYYKGYEQVKSNVNLKAMINELGLSNYNHKVKKIEVINLKKKVPVYDIMVEGQENFLVDAGVILHNCYRHAYWATKNNYKYGDPERRPSNITNPNNTGAVCKHTTAALVRPSQWLKYVSGWISTVVRAYLQNKLGINAEDTGDLVDPEDAEDVKDEIESIQDLKSEKEEFEDSEVEVPAEDMETEEETEEVPEKEEENSEEEK